jgi:hypothetical protein
MKNVIAQHEAELASINLTSISQIASLPWVGNHAFDYCLFKKCNLLLASLTDREEQRECVHLTTLHGMGIDEPVSDEELDECLIYAHEDLEGAE